MPLVSIIIPSFNSEAFIEETISSVNSQSYKSWELIIVDDCSTDSTVCMVAKLAHDNDRIRLIRLDKNSGLPAVPRNVGIKESKGDYIAFLDADDLWHPEKLSIQVNEIIKGKGVMVSSQMLNFSGHMTSPPCSLDDIENSFVSLYDQLIKYRTPTSSLLVKSSVMRKMCFDINPSIRGREDLRFSLKLHAVYGDSIKINKPLVYYRMHNGQVSSNKFKMLFGVFYVILTTDINKYNWLKVLLPFFIVTNMTLSVYYRIIKGSL